MTCTAVRLVGSPDWSPFDREPNQHGDAMQRRQVARSEGTPLPPADASTKMLVKSLRLMEHLTATAYDDGAMRRPGYLWLKTIGQAWELTLFDEDACARLPLRANKVDDVLALAEAMLAAADAPWQYDQWMAERQAQKKKKKAG